MPGSEVIPIPYRILALTQEQNRLFAVPLEPLAESVREAGFRCDCCGRCCTRTVNRHIFLLDRDVTALRTIDPSACEPAPEPEFCDTNGMFYVSGYAMRMKDDAEGSCWFLKNGKCSIYDRRFSICRIYPHMFRRGTGASGEFGWQQFARKNRHGCYGMEYSDDQCMEVAREIKEYEHAFLSQQIAFLERIDDHFAEYGLHHDPVAYKKGIERFRQGKPVDIMVFHSGDFELCRMTRAD